LLGDSGVALSGAEGVSRWSILALSSFVVPYYPCGSDLRSVKFRRGQMNEKNHEIELRALLKDIDQAKFIKKIEALGADFRGSVKIIDHYFCPKETKSFAECEMNAVGSFALRLRETEKDNQKKNELNIKVITSLGDHHAWEEHETEVSSPQEMQKILEATGQKQYIEIAKMRTTYALGEILVNVEDIKNFGLGLELEIMATKADAEAAKEKLKDVLKKLGIDEAEIVPKSITNIIMHEQSKF